MKKAILKTAIIVVLLLNIISLCSCSSKGWSCQKRYVYVPITKEYIKQHQAGLDSYDKLILNKKVKSVN